jgi:hypothetical protein
MFAGMRIKIDSEEMSILDVTDATTIEVLRAANATTAATHSDGVAISDAAPELHEYVLATSAKNTAKKEYLQRISSRTGLIKSFLNHYSTNIDFPQRHTTLAEALDNSETGVDVGDTSNLNVNDIILVDDEQMLITAISAPTLTVTRGYNSTSAVTHVSGENVFTVDERFTESLQKYRKSMIYKLDGRSKKSALKHVALAADTEPHGTTSTDQLYGFDFYVAPNLSSTATSHKPDTYFNYFKKGTRPTTNSLGPSAFGLNVQLPTPDTLTDGDFVETGRMLPITESNLTRPKKNIYTDAAYSFAVSSKGDEGDALAVPQTEVFEIIKITSLSSIAAGQIRWAGYDMSGGVAGTDSSEMGRVLVGQLDGAISSTSATTITLRDATTDNGLFGDNPTDTIPVGATLRLSGESLRVTAVSRANDQITVVRGVDGTTAATHIDGVFLYYENAYRIQYISNTAAATGAYSSGEEVYMMISDIDKQIDNNSLIWQTASSDTDGVLMVSVTTGHSWRLKERPRMKYGVRRTFNADTGAETNPDAIREQIASVLIRKSNNEVRGDISTFNPPTFYIDNVPSSVATTSGSDQTITIGNTQLYGTLNEGLDDSETGIDVTDSTGMYVGQRIKIDSEEFAITAVNSKVLITATRAQNSTSAATHTSGATIFDSNVNIQNYGFQRGMLAVELDANGKPSGTYGYASRVTSTTVRVTWATGTVDTSSTIRYYIPVRAGDTIKVRNDLANVNSTTLVTQVTYEEGQGISRTRYDVVGADTNKEGGSGKSSVVAKTADAVAANEGLPVSIDIANDANITTSCVFSSGTSASQVDWAAGNLYIGADKYAITAGDTSSLETLNSDGRIYFVYYIKGDTTFRVIAKSNYPTFVAKRRDNDIKVIAHVHYDLPYAAWSLVGIKGGNVGDNTRLTGTQAQMRNFYADDGGALLPGFSFASDTDTGMYRTGTGTIGFSLGNSKKLEVQANGINVSHASISGTNAVINTSSGQLGLDSSSKRYKRNIVETALDSSKVYDLKPIDFEYNENTDSEGEKGFGLVAEDVEKIYPEIVHYNQDGLVESLAYDRLSLLLLMEIKKLKEEIEKLKENN